MEIPEEKFILKDLEINEELIKLKQKIEKNEEKYKIKRTNYISEKLQKIEDKKLLLNKNLEDIDFKLENNYKIEFKEKNDLLNQKKKWKDKKKEEKEMIKNILKRKKELLIEKLIQNKLNLEKILKKIKKLRKKKRIITFTLDAIDEEKEKRDLDNINLLNKALKKADLIEDNNYNLNEDERILLAENLLNLKIDEKFNQKELLEKLFKEKIHKNYLRKKENEIKIKNFNTLKFNIIKEEEDFLLKKAYYIEKIKDNPEAKLPNFDLIKNNLNVDINKYRNIYTKDKILNIGYDFYKNGQVKIDNLKLDLFEYNYYQHKLIEDKNDLKYFFENCNKESLDVAKYYMNIVISKVRGLIGKKEKEMEINVVKNRENEKRFAKIKFDMEEKIDKIVFNQIINEFFDKKIDKWIKETSRESIFLAQKAYINISNIWYKSLKISNKDNENVKDIKIISQNFKNKNLIKIKEKLIITFKNETSEIKKKNINYWSFEEKIDKLNKGKDDNERSILNNDNCLIF